MEEEEGKRGEDALWKSSIDLSSLEVVDDQVGEEVASVFVRRGSSREELPVRLLCLKVSAEGKGAERMWGNAPLSICVESQEERRTFPLCCGTKRLDARTACRRKG
jgi:hypothetical protein